MKKKFFCILLSVTLVAVSFFALAACNLKSVTERFICSIYAQTADGNVIRFGDTENTVYVYLDREFAPRLYIDRKFSLTNKDETIHFYGDSPLYCRIDSIMYSDYDKDEDREGLILCYGELPQERDTAFVLTKESEYYGFLPNSEYSITFERPGTYSVYAIAEFESNGRIYNYLEKFSVTVLPDIEVKAVEQTSSNVFSFEINTAVLKETRLKIDLLLTTANAREIVVANGYKDLYSYQQTTSFSFNNTILSLPTGWFASVGIKDDGVLSAQ
ncbi:MAG: hypothetical protein LBT30_07705 [Clostridiales bacterium]|jgi:hypothetical protein|nr:hypothetical protein [Clostridiales bacterium]